MTTSSPIICPLCKDPVDKLLYRYHLGNERQVIERIKEHNPAWTENDGACGRCVDYYHTEIVIEQRILPEVGPFFPVKSPDDFVILPTGLRLDADPRFTGKGVTICFIDSGFYIHPDISTFKNRIKKVIDSTAPENTHQYFTEPYDAAWHGTMTTVVCAGDGYLSNGLYKGIASDAELVLLKVQNDVGRISTENIVKALEWVLANYQKYAIRIVNMSLGDDEAVSYKQSEIDRLTEELFQKGVIIVAAVGNDEQGKIKPPANSPNVIAVGGADDQNTLEELSRLYHSAYGITSDGLMKPELIAQAIWIAAPILPGTKEQEEAAALYTLIGTADDQLIPAIKKLCTATKLEYSVTQSNDTRFIRQSVIDRIRICKYISPHYMHVDGTSFAAPIVSSVIAQMLEVNPDLTPAQVRDSLFRSAKRIEGLAAERQGFGVICPRKVILKNLKRDIIIKPQQSPVINEVKKIIEFYVQHDCASQIALAGSFNHWAQDVLLLEPGEKGWWKIQIPMLPAGKYQYKYFVDEKVWIEDVDNPYKEPDGYHGFNSILEIKN